MKRIASVLTVCVLLSSFTGCGSVRAVRYSTRDVKPLSNPLFTSKTLVVKKLIDNREMPEGITNNTVSLTSASVMNGRPVFVNGRYDSQKLGEQLAKMIVKHVNRTRLFETAMLDDGVVKADYILSGTLRKFDACLVKSRTTQIFANGAVAGALGVLATAGVRSPYRAHTLLVDLQLVRASDGQVVWQGQAEALLEGETWPDAYGCEVYDLANKSAKAAVGDLLTRLASEVFLSEPVAIPSESL